MYPTNAGVLHNVKARGLTGWQMQHIEGYHSTKPDVNLDELQFTKEKEGAKGEHSSTQKQLKVPPVTSYDMKELETCDMLLNTQTRE